MSSLEVPFALALFVLSALTTLAVVWLAQASPVERPQTSMLDELDGVDQR